MHIARKLFFPQESGGGNVATSPILPMPISRCPALMRYLQALNKLTNTHEGEMASYIFSFVCFCNIDSPVRSPQQENKPKSP